MSKEQENTFQFKSFFQQLAEVNIDVVHQIKDSLATPDDVDTFFYETLVKYDDLCCSQCFENFKCDLPFNTRTLPQLVLRVNEVVECLKTHLLIPDTTCYIPLFELVVALSRDLQCDFYSYFPDFFHILVKLLSVKDAEIIQEAFKTIAYLFKSLWRYMINDIENVWRLYFPLLGDGKADYIRNFSAESIAFLLRKIQDKSALLNLIFGSLKDSDGYSYGTGMLLFEVLRGVQHQFRSNFDQMFYLILSKLGCGLGDDISLPWDDVVTCQLQMIDAMLKYTTRELSSNMWAIFMKVINELAEKCKFESGEKQILILQHLERVLQLFQQAVCYKSTKYVHCSKSFLKIILDLLASDYLSEVCGIIISNIVSSLLFSRYLTFDMGTINCLLSSFYNSKFSCKIKLSFTTRMYPYGMFEKDVLGHFLKYCKSQLVENNHSEEVLVALTDLILHFQPLPVSSDNLNQWKQFSMLLSSNSCNNKQHKNRGILNYLEEWLLLQDTNDFAEKIPLVWSAVILLPHVSHAQRTVLQVHLMDLYSRLLQYSMKEEIDDSVSFLLLQVVETILLTMEVDEIEEIISPADIQKLLLKYPSSIHCLMVADFYLSFMERKQSLEFLNADFSNPLIAHLLTNVGSPFHEVRMLTLRILKMLHGSNLHSEDQGSIFDICLSAESIEVGVSTFREKIRLLQKLDYNNLTSTIHDLKFSKAPLYYLIGVLYVNFLPLWEPTMKLIESYARGMNRKSFWDVFNYHLKSAANLAEYTVKKKLISSSSSCENSYSLDINQDLLALFRDRLSLTTTADRPDYLKYRELLWKTMVLISDISEAQTELLSPLFLRFMKNEYCHFEFTHNISQDFRRRQLNETIVVSSASQSSLPDVISDESFAIERQNENRSKCPGSFKRFEALCAHLELFSKFVYPHKVHMEPELYKLYLDLLMHPHTAVQRLALACIITYNYSFIVPYQEYLTSFIEEEEMLNSNLVAFNIHTGIDFKNTVAQEEHRDELIPIVIRILFGKLRKWKASRRKESDIYKNIFKFFANLKESEMKMLLNIAFQDYQCYNEEEDVLSVVQNIWSNHDFSHVLSLSKQMESLRMLSIMFRSFPHRLSPYLSRLLKLLLIIVSNIAVMLENRDEVENVHIERLKDGRIAALKVIIEFFERFQHYPFSEREIDALFLVAVWPQLPFLPNDAATTPTCLLKLFHYWSSNPRYFLLLIKQHPTDTSLSPFPKVLDLFLRDKTHSEIVSLVLEILEKLLTTNDDQNVGDDRYPLIEISDVIPIFEGKNGDGKQPIQLGTRIVLPHLKPILMKLKMLIENTDKTSKTMISERYLTVLARLSEFKKDVTFITKMFELLLQFISKNLTRNEDEDSSILSAMINLIKFVDDPKQFVKPLCMMFGTQTNRGTRVALCDILDAFAKRDEKLINLSSIAKELNAWNPKRPEEPDFTRRITGFQNTLKIIDEGSSDQFYLLIVCNCCYFVKTVDDLSLRNNASNCLQKVLLKVGASLDEQPQLVDVLVNPFLRHVRQGLTIQTELIRHEFITILSVGVEAFNRLPVFNELHLLKHADVELNFFENIKHMQIHRRARALSRLANGDVIKQFSSNILMNYIKVFADVFLFDHSSADSDVLLTSAVELIGKISSYLPWSYYEKLLSSYLHRLCTNIQFQKILTKIVIAVLDAFHFDISSSELATKAVLPPIRTLKEEVRMPDMSQSSEPFDEEQICDDENPAKEIYDKVTGSILPQLYNCLMEKIPGDISHKLAKPHDVNESEKLRVPVAIAVVKLLQKLPKEILERSISRVLLKIIVLLKSRDFNIRKKARRTLLTISESLGPEYLQFIVTQMRVGLTKGYQVHVMIYTLHAILNHLKSRLQIGDIDAVMKDLIEICHDELFGAAAEEKKVDKIIANLEEAKSTVAFSMYKIMGTFVSSSRITNLVMPLKMLIIQTTSHDTLTKAQTCFEQIILGVMENASLQSKELLIFCHGIINEHISGLKHIGKIKDEPEVTRGPVRPDTYLIPKEPGRSLVPAHISARTNEHNLVEFGIKLMYFGFKKRRICVKEQQILEMLDPFVPILSECLRSSHVELILFSLRTLRFLLKVGLPSFKKYSDDIASQLFKILKSYNSSDNRQHRDMVIACFAVLKCLTNGNCYNMSEDQLRTVLVYIEQDMHDNNKQAKAFSMLETILAKELIVPEIHEIMGTVGKLAISSLDEHVRLRCRHSMLKYLLDYPLGNRLAAKLDFIAIQLGYGEEYGVESALELLTSILMSFPAAIVNEHAPKFFVHLALCLINNESTKCRKMAALATKVLIEKVSAEVKATLFSLIHTWLEDDKTLHQKLGMQLCGLFIEVEKEKFYQWLKDFFPVLIKQLQANEQEVVTDDEKLQQTDHLKFQALTTLSKLLMHTSILRDRKWQYFLNQTWNLVEKLLVHPHAWVKLQASQLFGLLFAAYPVDQLIDIINSSQSRESHYLAKDIVSKIISLSDDFCNQLKSAHLVSEIGTQVAKNMVYIAKVVHGLPENARVPQAQYLSKNISSISNDEEPSSSEKSFSITVTWLIKKLRGEAQREIMYTPKVTVKRTCFYTWIAAVSRDLGKELVQQHLSIILPLLMRETNNKDSDTDESLVQLAQDVLELIKDVVGLDVFSTEYAAVQTARSSKRATRKLEQATKAVMHPHISARKKIRKHTSLKESRKRKFTNVREGRAVKKSKRKRTNV